jgi:hypothetical protein
MSSLADWWGGAMLQQVEIPSGYRIIHSYNESGACEF